MVLDGIQFAAYRCFHCAASFMAQNQEKRRLKVAARILHAAHDLRRNDVSGDANDEQFAEIGIEDQFGRNARIATSDYGRVRSLPARQIGESLFADGGKARFALTKPVVTFDKPLQCLIGGNVGLLKMIGGHYVLFLESITLDDIGT
jgi:hypothetical protein